MENRRNIYGTGSVFRATAGFIRDNASFFQASVSPER